ncbi:efflux RND transporter periplasmic adaptor subunit [Actinoplanes sp. RD1]|uniref:efflux RND transporter periplasmic adaptor subunit n=1 Tax=Actinoplanes sp. RD1 TaxID=3064538 RepID=UPI0027428515|nr:efflux RND transporter periplasmic adaptor subunit [Actinoplanes sp. RD1]
MGIGLTAWRGGNRRWVLVAAGVLVVLLVAAGVAVAMNAGADEAPKTVAATVGVDTGAVTAEVATTGTVEPAQTRTLSFTVAGTVESVKVRAGTAVQAGQALASVDDSDAQSAVDSAEETLADAQDSLAEAQDAADDGSTSTTTTGCVAPAAYADPAPTSASPSPTATRMPSASPTKTVSPTRTTSPAATRTTQATKAPTTTAPAQTGAPRGTQGTGGNQGSGGTSTCGQSGNQGTQGGGQGSQQGGDAVLSAQQRVNQAEVALADAEDDLEGTTITAPIRGKVLSVAGKVGSQVSGGSTFITLADVYDMQISADFPEADAGRLAVRQKAAVTLADRAGESFAATVVQVDPVGTSDGTMVTYGVVLSFDEAPADLLVGQTAAVRVTTGSADDVLRVPSTAVHDVAGTSGTVLKGGAKVTVGVGLRGDTYTEITSGLAQGDVVSRSW